MTIDEIHPEGDIPDCEEIIKQIENESFQEDNFCTVRKTTQSLMLNFNAIIWSLTIVML